MVTQVHWWMILSRFLSSGRGAGGNYNDTSFYYFIKVPVLNAHCRFLVLHLKFWVFHLQIFCVCCLPLTASMLALEAMLMLFLMFLRTRSLYNGQLLSCSVASLWCFHTAKWCLSGLSGTSSWGSHHSRRFFSDLPPSLLVIQHLLHHTNSSIITVQRHLRRERLAAPNWLLSLMLLCVMGMQRS